MKDHTSAPMAHQVPGADYLRCKDCNHFTPGLSESGLGVCMLAVIRTRTSADGFISQVLPYSNQIACDQFSKNPD